MRSLVWCFSRHGPGEYKVERLQVSHILRSIYPSASGFSWVFLATVLLLPVEPDSPHLQYIVDPALFDVIYLRLR